ncbi:calcineurin B, partial [Reticulomyxa filosa]
LPVPHGTLWGAKSDDDTDGHESGNETTESDNAALNYVQRVLKLADEDGDGKVDFVEFADAVDDLGVDIDRKLLEFVFARWVIDENRLLPIEPEHAIGPLHAHEFDKKEQDQKREGQTDDTKRNTHPRANESGSTDAGTD